MALTEDQKKSVIAKRDALVQSGLSLQDATRAAFDEVAGAGEFDKKVAQKAKTPPVKDVKQIERETAARKMQTSLIQSEQEWVRSRRDELKRAGYGEAEAASQAQKEFNKEFGQAPSAGFGEYSERVESYIDPTAGIAEELSKSYIPEVLRSTFGRQLYVPKNEYSKSLEAERFTVPGLVFQTSAVPSGIGPDFNSIKEVFAKDLKSSNSELSAEEIEKAASNYTNSLRAAYEVTLAQETEAATRINPDLPDVIRQSTDVKGISSRALEKALKEVSEIDSVPMIQPEKARSEEIRKTSGSALEVAGAAFGKQETAGAGVPDYSDAQIAFLKSEADREKETEVQKRLTSKPEKTVYEYTKDGKTVRLEKAEYDARIAIPDDPIQTVKITEVKVPKTEKEIRSEVEKDYPTTWYLDPAKKKKYLANPEDYLEKGILSDTTIYGGQKETVTGQLLRGALSLPNAFAGLASGIFEAPLTEGGEAIAAEKRKRRPELYKDSPILYNIAENRGFFGEAQEVADILELEGVPKYVYLAGTFAADILDPSLDIATAAGRGLKVTAQARAASKALGALGSTSTAASAAKAGLKAAANDILDTTFLSVVAKDPRKVDGVRGAPVRFAEVNPRTVATADLTASLEDSQKIADSIKADANITADAAKANLGNTGYAREFNKAADAAPGAKASDIAAELSRRESLIKTADEISKGLDEIVSTGSTRLIRSKELARQLGALASTDETVAAAFKAVDDNPKTDVQKIAQYVEALDDTQKSRLRKGLLYDAASTEVYRKTSTMSALDNIVAITKNTFVNKTLVPKIMAKVSESPIGKLSDKIKDSKIIFKATEKGVVQSFDIASNTVAKEELLQIAESLSDFRKLDAESLRRIKRDVNNGFITTSDFRALVDGNVDLIAEAIALTGKEVVRARDVARLPIIKQQDLLVPLESRAFTREVFKEVFASLTSRFKRAPSRLSIGQQRLLSEATSRAANLDIKLRTSMQDLFGKISDDIKAAYGIKSDTKDLTKSQALAYSILGPTALRTREAIKSVLDFALQNLFYNKSLKQDIFNLFTGVDIARDTSILTANGKVYFDILTDAAAKRINNAPESFWQELIGLSDEYRRLLVEAKSNGQVAQEFFSVNPSEIVDIATEGGERFIQKWIKTPIREKGGKVGKLVVGKEKAIPQEVSVALYYKAEADRIQKELLSDLINKEIGKGQITLESTISENYFNFIKDVESRLGLEILDNYPKIISNRLKAMLTNPAWRTTPIGESDIAAMFIDESKIIDDLKNQIKEKTKKRVSRQKAANNIGIDTTAYAEKLKEIKQKLKDKTITDPAIRQQEVSKLKKEAKKLFDEALRKKAKEQIATKIESTMANPEAMSAISTIVERAEDIALGIKRQNGLSDVASISAIEDTIQSIVKGDSDEAAQLKLLFGEDVAAQISKSMEDGFSSLKEDLSSQLVRAYEGRGPLTAVADTIKDIFEKINDFRYTFLLNFRPRFHGANLITAADIYYQTTGKLPNYIDAAKGLALTDVARRDPSRIILQSSPMTLRGSVSPKIYTAREVYDMLSTMGGKSVYTLTAPNLANKRILNLTDDDFKIFGDWWSSLQNLPTIEDMAFRYSVFADAIRAGRSEDEALELARKSMFDAADITALERPLQKLLMFYGFARNNFVNFLKNMGSPEGIKRIIKGLKLERNVNNLNTSEEDREFAPGYTQTKTIFEKLPISDEKDLYLTSSSIATKEAVKLFGELVKGNFGEVLSGMVNPTYKEILGISGSMDRDPTKISPEHIALMKLIPFSTPGDISSFIVGSDIVPKVAKPEDGAVDGYIYPLNTPSQIKRYKAFIDFLSYSGLAAPMTDWSRTVFGEGTPVGQLNFSGKAAYALGGITPSYGIPAWKQDYFNKLSKLQAIKASAAKIEKEVEKETAIESAAIPQTPEQKAKVEEIKTSIAVGESKKADAKALQARKQQIQRELNKALPPNREIYIDMYNGNREKMMKEYVNPRKEELKKIDEELKKQK